MARKVPGLADLARGVRMRGAVAEVYRYGNRAGVLWDWSFEGGLGDFRVEAERYKFDRLMWGDEANSRVTLRLLIGETGLVECEGYLWTQAIIDGRGHDALVVKGDKARWQDEPAVPVAMAQRSA